MWQDKFQWKKSMLITDEEVKTCNNCYNRIDHIDNDTDPKSTNSIYKICLQPICIGLYDNLLQTPLPMHEGKYAVSTQYYQTNMHLSVLVQAISLVQFSTQNICELHPRHLPKLCHLATINPWTPSCINFLSLPRSVKLPILQSLCLPRKDSKLKIFLKCMQLEVKVRSSSASYCHKFTSDYNRQ